MTDEQADQNVRAFLDMLALSEGTYGVGDNGYDVLVGSLPGRPVLFHGYADHPRVSVVLRPGPIPSRIVSTAAGRYQILARNYDAYRTLLHLPDFGPASQDAIALQLVKEQHAMDDVRAGRLDEAVHKCSNIWASLSGAGYGQRENGMVTLRGWFIGRGGVLEL